jgi:hypothetical protein
LGIAIAKLILEDLVGYLAIGTDIYQPIKRFRHFLIDSIYSPSMAKMMLSSAGRAITSPITSTTPVISGIDIRQGITAVAETTIRRPASNCQNRPMM